MRHGFHAERGEVRFARSVHGEGERVSGGLEVDMAERERQAGDGEIGTCHVCGARFELQEDLIKHVDEAHSDDLLE